MRLIVLATLLAIGLNAAETRTVEVRDITLDVPEHWKDQPVRSSMRAAQFAIGEKVELVVFFFGASGGGGVEANINRWVGQFDAEGREVERANGGSKQGDWEMVTIKGTFNKSVGPPIMQKSMKVRDAVVLGLILRSKAGSYFLKMNGPRDAVLAERDALLRSVGRN
jgi:gluconolactonase